MSNKSLPKNTSFAYGQEYQEDQVIKHRQRHSNHWKPRIELAHNLVDVWVLPRFSDRTVNELSALDVGCSIGTIAIEMALRGFKTNAVDFDSSAIEIAKLLCTEEEVNVEFYIGDVAEWESSDGNELVDVAFCFDIFEHLHDDELGSMLQSIRRHLSNDGALVFYTFPLQYDYIFYSRNIISWPLWPFRWLSQNGFSRVVRTYALIADVFLMFFYRQNL